MKFLIIAIALCIAASASADVSHLNNEYLPPHSAGGGSEHHHHHHEHHDDDGYRAHQSQPIPVVHYAPVEQTEAAPAPAETHEAHASYEASQVVAVADEQSYVSAAAENQEVHAAPAEAVQQYAPAEVANYELSGEQQPAAAEEQFTYDNAIPSAEYNQNSFAPAATSGFGSAAQDVVAQYVAQGTTHEHVHVHHDAHASSGIDTKYGTNGGYVY